MSHQFAKTPALSGFMQPCRFEGEVFDLTVEGTIPKEIDGTFYRVMPDPQVPGTPEANIWFNGDGTISAFRIKDGSVDFKQRYVHTEKFVRERRARKSLFGSYRNRYTNHPCVRDVIQGTANTNIVYWNGVLLALKEDSPPYAMDPDTLETLGVYTFDGQITDNRPFTAHPKFHPDTGDMSAFGYCATGDATLDMWYGRLSKTTNKLLDEVWFKSPYPGMQHDCAITDNWIIFQLLPLVVDLDRLKAGGQHWEWDDDRPCYYGVLPRVGANAEDIKWLPYKNSFPGHVSNAFENEDGEICIDSGLSSGNVFSWFPNKKGEAPEPSTLLSPFIRWTFDPRTATKLPEPVTITEFLGEFPRCDDRYAGKRYKHSYLSVRDFSKPFDAVKARDTARPGFNSIGHINVETGETETYWPGSTSGTQECVFVPRNKDAEEGDGFVMFLVNRYETMTSDLVILDTNKFSEPVCTINLPLRLRNGLHGNWVDASEFKETKPLVDWPEPTPFMKAANGVH